MKPEEQIEQFFCWYETDDYLEQYNANRAALRALFEEYRSATGETRTFMDQLLTAHAAFGKCEKKPEVQRAHNSFVLRYVAGSKIKEIAKYLNISGCTVLRDIDLVFDDLMIFAFGVAGMVPYEYITVYDTQ